ncbi:MAG TPA: tetratricopeptide repeat protein [Candidatus Dormibacteraeota bacterium]|nr:tetratricopeptide repeat protein [Candidatus Dormibacteraeota bacterium]
MLPGSCQFSTLIALVIALLPPAATAQRGGSTSSSSSRNIPSTRTPGTPDSSTKPLFISGKVMLEGGRALPEPVPIERVCNGTVRREGYADIKGQFEFQLGLNLTFQDASENDSRIAPNAQSRSANNGQRSLDLNGCELRAVLAGYQSSVVILRTTGGDTWQYEVGTIFLKRIGNAPGTTISVTSMAAPRDAMRAYEKAQKIKTEKPAEAEKELNKAVKVYPQFAAAWALLGDIHRERNEFDAARTEYARAIAADPQFVNPSYGLTMIAAQEKKWDDAIRLSDQVIKLNSAAYPLVYFLNAAANYNLQKFEAAEDSAKKFKALDTQHSHPDVCLLLSYLFSARQDYAAAAREIREYLAISPNSPEAESLKNEAKRFEDLSVSAKRE